MKKAEEKSRGFLKKETKKESEKKKDKTLEEKIEKKEIPEPEQSERDKEGKASNNDEGPENFQEKKEDFFFQQRAIEIPVTSLENSAEKSTERLEESLPSGLKTDKETEESRKSDYRISDTADNLDRDYEPENREIKNPFFIIPNAITGRNTNNREDIPELKNPDFESPFKEILKKDRMYIPAEDNENFPFFSIEKKYRDSELRQ